MKRSFDKALAESLKAKIVTAVNVLLKQEGIDAIAAIHKASHGPNEFSGSLEIVIRNSLTAAGKEVNMFAEEHGLVPVGRYYQMAYKNKGVLVTPVEFVRGKQKVVVQNYSGSRYTTPVDLYQREGLLELECVPTISDEELTKIIETSKAEVIDKVMKNLPVGEDFEQSKVDLAW